MIKNIKDCVNVDNVPQNYLNALLLECLPMQIIEHFIEVVSLGGTDKAMTMIKAKHKLIQLKQKDKISEEYKIAVKKTMLEYITKFPNKGVIEDILIGYSKASSYDSVCEIDKESIIEKISVFIKEEGLYEIINILRLIPDLHHIIAPLLCQWKTSDNYEEEEYIMQQFKEFTYSTTYEDEFGINPFDIEDEFGMNLFDIEDIRNTMADMVQSQIDDMSLSVKLKIVKEIVNNICENIEDSDGIEQSKIEIKELQNKNKTLMSAIKIADSEIDNFKDEINKLENRVIKKDNNIEKLKQKITVLNNEKKENQKMINVIKKNNNDLERKFRFLEGDFKNLKNKNAELITQSNKTQNMNKDLLSLEKKYKSDFENLQNEIKIMNSDNLKLKLDIDYLNEKLELSESEKNLMFKKIDNYEEEIILLKKQLNLLNKKNHRFPNSKIEIGKINLIEDKIDEFQVNEKVENEDISKEDMFDIIKNEPKYK